MTKGLQNVTRFTMKLPSKVLIVSLLYLMVGLFRVLKNLVLAIRLLQHSTCALIFHVSKSVRNVVYVGIDFSAHVHLPVTVIIALIHASMLI